MAGWVSSNAGLITESAHPLKNPRPFPRIQAYIACLHRPCADGRVAYASTGAARAVGSPGWHFPIRVASKPSPTEEGTHARKVCPYVVPSWSLSNSSRISLIFVLSNLSCSTISFRWCSMRRTRNSSASPSTLSSHWSISKTVPSIVSERSFNLSNSAWDIHSTLPSTWTSPSLRHSPSALRILSISQRGCWLADCSLVSTSWATGARSFRLGLSTSPVNGTRPKARVDGGSTLEIAAASAPERHPHFVVVLIVARVSILIAKG